MIRKISRNMARNAMERQGVDKFNKKDGTKTVTAKTRKQGTHYTQISTSKFSRNWRKFFEGEIKYPGRRPEMVTL